MTRKWLTVPEAGRYFGIKPKTLYSLVGRGLLPEKSFLKLGRSLRLNIEIIEKEGIKER